MYIINYSRSLFKPVFLIFLLSLLMTAAVPLHAYEWQNILDTGESGCSPVLKYDNGILHMAYFKWWPTATGGAYYMKSIDNGASWSMPVEIKKTTGTDDKVRNLNMAVNGSKVLITWLNVDFGVPSNVGPIYSAVSTDSGDTWSSNVLVTNCSPANNRKIKPSCGIDSSGKMYVGWYDGYFMTRNYIFSVSTNNGQDWAIEKRYASGPICGLGDFTVSGDDLYITYSRHGWAGLSHYSSVYLVKKVSGTWDGAWTTVDNHQIFFTPGSSLYYWFAFPDIEIDSNKNQHIVFDTGDARPIEGAPNDYIRTNSRVIYETSKGSWVTARTLGVGYTPSIGIDGDDKLYVTYYYQSGYSSGPVNAWGEIMYCESSDGGTNWSTPVAIASNVSDPWFSTDLEDVQAPVHGKHAMAVTPDGQVIIAWREDNVASPHILVRLKGAFGVSFIDFNTPDPDNHSTSTVRNNGPSYVYKNGETVDLTVSVSANAVVTADFSRLDDSSSAVSVESYNNNDGTRNIIYAISLDNLYAGKELPVTIKAVPRGGGSAVYDRSFLLDLANPIYSETGGKYVMGDGTLIEIQKESFEAESVNISVNRAGLIRKITPSGFLFKKPATLRIPYTDAQLSLEGLDSSSIGIFKMTGDTTAYIGGDKVTDEYGNNTLQAKIDTLGDYFISAYISSAGNIANFKVSGSLVSLNNDGVNDAVIFSFESSCSEDSIKIEIFDSLGRIVKTLKQGRRSWFGDNEQGKEVRSGLYIYKVQACGEYKAGKIVVVK